MWFIHSIETSFPVHFETQFAHPCLSTPSFDFHKPPFQIFLPQINHQPSMTASQFKNKDPSTILTKQMETNLLLKSFRVTIESILSILVNSAFHNDPSKSI